MLINLGSICTVHATIKNTDFRRQTRSVYCHSK